MTLPRLGRQISSCKNSATCALVNVQAIALSISSIAYVSVFYVAHHSSRKPWKNSSASPRKHHPNFETLYFSGQTLLHAS